MASTKTPKKIILLHKIVPFLFKTCDGGNWHWKWDRLCFCQYNENGHKIIDLKTGKEYDFIKNAIR